MYQIPNNFCQFYIVRHGETTMNKAYRIQGHQNSDLTENAIEKARELGKKLKNIEFSATFSSDLLRAKKTAELLQAEKESTIIATELIKERRMGVFEGKKVEELSHKLKKILYLLGDSTQSNLMRAHQIETVDEMTQRINLFLRKTALAYKNKRVLVVTHGGVIGRLLLDLGYQNAQSFEDLKIANLSYLVLNSDGIEYQIAGVNNIDVISSDNSK